MGEVLSWMRFLPRFLIVLESNADVAELVDALDLGSSVLVT